MRHGDAMPLPASAIPEPLQENEPADAVHESREMLALLARRRSTKVGHLAEPGPSDEQINALLRLAARVPDHGKLGPWRFVVIAGDGRARAGEALANVIAKDDGVDAVPPRGRAGPLLRRPFAVMVVSEPRVFAKGARLGAGAIRGDGVIRASARRPRHGLWRLHTHRVADL